MNELYIILLSLISPPEAPRTVMSSSFGSHGDEWAGGDALLYGRPIDPDRDICVAHRSLPLGSLIVVENPRNNRRIVAEVCDRGPYGAIADKSEVEEHPEAECVYEKDANRCWYVKKRSSWPGKWRGGLDLSPLAAKKLGHNGFQRVRWWKVGR